MKVCGQFQAPAALLLQKDLGTHLIEGWVNSRIGKDIVEKKYLPSIGFRTTDLPTHRRNATPTTVNLKKGEMFN